MEEETATTTATAASPEQEPSKANENIEKPKEKGDESAVDSTESTEAVKDFEMKENEGKVVEANENEEVQKHGLKRKASEMQENNEEKGKEKKKKEDEVEEKPQEEEKEAAAKDTVTEAINEVKEPDESEIKGECLYLLLNFIVIQISN